VRLQAAPAAATIRSLNTDNGLSSHNISCVMQDDLGYLWVGTDDGLNRYDGVKFQVYRNEPGDSLSLSDTRITALLANTHKGRPELWVGTRNGLNHIDLKTGRITRFMHDLKQKNSLSNPVVKVLTVDSLGLLWVGTTGGLNLLTPEDRSTGEFFHFFESNGDSAALQISSLAISKDEQGLDILWVGTRRGLKQITYSNEVNCSARDFSFARPGFLPMKIISGHYK